MKKNQIFQLLLLVHLVTLPSIALIGQNFQNSNCDPQSDRDILLELHNATNGATWTNQWNLAEPMSQWYGITLSSNGCVSKIALGNNNLVGTIPANIGNLSELTELFLNFNQLSGSIPVEIGNLTNLTHLYLYANHLDGSIPIEVGNLTNLTHLWLSNNQLNGSIPTELGNLTNLTHLLLNNNQLNGNIPAELNHLQSLQDLYLSDNQLSGNIPAGLGNLTNLTYLDLSDNQLSGSIPSELGSLTNLTHLWLFSNQLNGSIPAELGNLTNLIFFRLYNNQLSGSIPAELSNLTNLSLLWLHNNQLSGCFPQELDVFCNINYGFFNNPDLPGGGDFAAFCNDGTGACDLTCDQRDYQTLVDLYNNTNGPTWTNQWNLADPMSTWYGITLSPVGCVCKIELGDNNLVGSIPSSLGTLSSLKELFLNHNQLSSAIPPEMANLQNLEKLYLHHNQLTGNIPSEIGNLSHLQHLILTANQLDGNLPSALGNLQNIELLYISSNQIEGEIPPELGDLNTLEQLLLLDNHLSGTIPIELANLSNLTFLHLADNNLTGVIPPALGALSNLEFLFLNENQLTGTVPTAIGQMINLQKLKLFDNQLTGPLPVNLSNLTNLNELLLNDNQFTDCFPIEYKNAFCGILYDFTNNPNLPSNGDFSAFCLDDTGQCEPSCSATDLVASHILMITDESADIFWELVGGIALYEIRYRKTGTSTWTMLQQMGSTAITSIMNLEADTEYEYQLRVFCEGTWTNWASPQVFTTLPCSEGNHESNMPLPLPDGTGEIHTSTVNISSFAPGQTIQQASEIYSISINIEHSWARDLEIKLICPNGTAIILHDHPNQIGGQVFLGEPNETDNGDPENPVPGLGYIYHWKADPSLPTWLEWANANMPFDPKDLPAGDYRSFASFDNLIGCPLNGNWTISIEDKWTQDNGFIFSWGIHFLGMQPIVQQQPNNQMRDEGEQAHFLFDVFANGHSLTYQWEVSTDGINFAPMMGENQAQLSLPNVTANQHNNQYRCIVTADCVATIISTPATLSINGVSLPLNLLEWSGQTLAKTNLLTWKTTSEKDILTFTVQKSLDAQTLWENVGTVTPQNRYSIKDYQWEDSNPSLKSFYRLAILEKSGKEWISDLIYLNRMDITNPSTVLFFPNPTIQQIHLKFNTPLKSDISIVLYNTLGEEVMYKEIQVGEKQSSLDLNFLNAGIYWCEIRQQKKLMFIEKIYKK